MSDRPEVTGKSTVSEVRNRNDTSLQQSNTNKQESTQQLPHTRKELAAVAEAAALRCVNKTMPNLAIVTNLH